MKKTEFEKFDRIMQELVKIPHSQIKARLNEEKKQKAKRKEARKRKR